MYRLARESQVRVVRGFTRTRGQEDDGLKVPTLPKRTAECLYPEFVESRKMPAASAPGAVTAPPKARDLAVVKQAAARDPPGLSLASPNSVYKRSEAYHISQARQTEPDVDIKQRHRQSEIPGIIPCTVPGTIQKAGIEAFKIKFSPDTAHTGSEARDSTQIRQIETDQDNKQRYQSAGTTSVRPGAARVACIDASNTEPDNDISYEDRGDDQGATTRNVSKNSKRGYVTRGQDDDDLTRPTMPHRNPEQAPETTKMPVAASVPGAVAVTSSPLDIAAIKQAAARDPARLAYFPAPRPSAAARFRASSPMKENRDDDDDIKQRYRNLNANQHEAPGGVKVSGIDGSTDFSINHSSFDANGMVMDASSAVSKDPEAVPVQGTTFTAQLAAELAAQLAPTDAGVTQSCFEDITVAETEAAPNRKRWIILVVIGLLACVGLGAGLGVALSGDDPSPRAAPLPPVRADTCLPADDNPGAFNCFKKNFPGTPTTTFFFNCPTNDEEKIFDCEFCHVAIIADINDLEDVENAALCSGCIICEDSVSFDCTNLFPEEECALQTCSGNCGKDPVPSPSPETIATECDNDANDGSYFCNKEDIPTDFLVTQFRDCPPGAENNVYECQSCVVAFEDNAAKTQECNGCINCGDSVAYDCSNIFPGQECSALDCDGNCFGDRRGGSSSGMETEPPTRADSCLDAGDGTFRCFKEAFPAEGVTTFFVTCPTNDEERIFECESCLVAGISDISEFNENSPVCNGCILCGESVSFDCTNLFPEEECALQTCSGNCGKDPVPSPSPDTEANECNNSVELDTFFCNKEDIPFDFLVTQFQDCPPGAENNVYECQSCFVVFEDSVADIDAATSQVCNGCINCGGSVAYDYSNIFPGQECAAVDCDGTCVGDRQA